MLKLLKNNRLSSNPYVLMVLILILWGTFAAVSKLSLRSLDSLQLQFYMFAIAFIAMTIICLFTGKFIELGKVSKKEIARLIIYSVPSFLYYILYLMAMMLIPAVEASMLNYLFPVMIVIFAVPINGETLDRKKLLSIVLGFAGVVIILTNGSLGQMKASNIWGDLLAIGAAISWGIFSNLGKRNKVDTFISNYIFTSVTFVLSTICMFMFSSFTLPDKPTLLGLLWISLSNIVFSYYLWFRALKLAPASLIASLSFITPFVTLFFIMLLVGEKISITQIIGLLIIIGGTAVQSLKLPKRLMLYNKDI